ncbi:MAG: LacI family DNA-binding transcriptional regulator [Phycisphaerales bacterium]|nr:LacI family DNA-binding transcriptional regulator [Phycisphaerales bacterium]
MSGRNKVTIEDISRETGLSRGTISRALNDRPDISAETKARVLAAVKKLNYVPSTTARSLATGRHFAVVVFVADLSDSFSAEFLRGVLIQAELARYFVNVVELGATEALADRIARLNLERLDGALLCSHISSPELAQLSEKLEGRLAVAAFPCVEVGHDSIVPDHAQSGRLVAEHLLGGGRREIAYLHDSAVPFSKERLAGFSEVSGASGVDSSAAIINVNSASSAAEIANALRARGPGLSGVAATNDELAVSALVALVSLGRQPGRDITVVGQGNAAFARGIAPQLSSTDLHAVDIGRRSMEMLVSRLCKTRTDATQLVAIEPHLEVRASSKPL